MRPDPSEVWRTECEAINKRSIRDGVADLVALAESQEENQVWQVHFAALIEREMKRPDIFLREQPGTARSVRPRHRPIRKQFLVLPFGPHRP
jgi:hypothetical protein